MENLLSFIGIVVPLFTIAGSACAYVVKYYQEARASRRREFFSILEIVDGKGSIAQKLGAIYDLRSFPEHRDFVLRFCRSMQPNIDGESVAAKALADEMQGTIDFFESY